MPKLRMTEEQQREKALRRAMARAQVDLDLPMDQDVADYLGLTRSTYGRRKQEPFSAFGFAQAVKFSRRMGFTAPEVLEIFGFQAGR